MSQPHTPPASLRDERGFTLIELLVAMVIGLIVSLGAFSLLEFTTSDVSRVTARAHVDQTGRVALEKIMLLMHSACVAVTVNPIQSKSNETEIKFISETSSLNIYKEPVSSLTTVRMHEIIYNKSTGTLTEKSWPSTAASVSPEYKFNETEAKTKHELTETTLLTGVKQTEITNETTHLTEKVPIFRYYRYYEESDTEAKLGQLDPGINNAGMSNAEMERENAAKETEAERVAKVTVSFTLTPGSKEGILAKGDQPVALEDSAIFRLATSSEATGNPNLPCTQTT
jgi:prepilin-type N-terminal cleavage/methylation domain-containing protein